MGRECAYVLSIVAAGFLVNYGLRALPFLLFAGRTQALPKWVTTLGQFVSPVIIGALVLYSFSGLAWKTPWPYVAGAITVALHLWKRNSLVSIVVGTILYMCLLTTGCVTAQTVSLDPSEPSLRVKMTGIYFEDRRVTAPEAAEILAEAGVPKNRTIPILLDGAAHDLREARFLMRTLAKAGYRRPVLVTPRHADAEKVDPRQKTAPSQAVRQPRPARPAIRYKKATE